MKCLDALLSLNGTLSAKKKQQRMQYFIFVSVGLFLSLVSLAVGSPEMYTAQPALCLANSLSLLGMSIGLCAVLCRFHLSTRLVVGTLYLIASAIFVLHTTDEAVRVRL